MNAFRCFFWFRVSIFWQNKNISEILREAFRACIHAYAEHTYWRKNKKFPKILFGASFVPKARGHCEHRRCELIRVSPSEKIFRTVRTSRVPTSHHHHHIIKKLRNLDTKSSFSDRFLKNFGPFFHFSASRICFYTSISAIFDFLRKYFAKKDFSECGFATIQAPDAIFQMEATKCT